MQDLFEKQKKLLDTFLSHGAITKAQYDKSFGDLYYKMKGIKEVWSIEYEEAEAFHNRFKLNFLKGGG